MSMWKAWLQEALANEDALSKAIGKCVLDAAKKDGMGFDKARLESALEALAVKEADAAKDAKQK